MLNPENESNLNMSDSESSENLSIGSSVYDNTAPPLVTEGVKIRWESKTANGFNLWRIKTGVFQFTSFPQNDLDLLAWGDQVKESHEKGSIRYVNRCMGCGQVFLHSTLILVPFYHTECQEIEDSRSKELAQRLIALRDVNPALYEELMDFIGEYDLNKPLVKKF